MNINYLFRKYTASLRSGPDYLIMGAQKAGTTSLDFYLSQHPDVYTTDPKELHYFHLEINRPLSEYTMYFPLKLKRILKPNLIAGEATPDYMAYPQIAKELKSLYPNIKLIFLLKEPVSRSFSHYKHNLMMKREWLSFEDAIEIESKRVNLDYIDIRETRKDAIKNYSNYSYLDKSKYAKQLEPFIELFPQNQILILQSEEFFKNTDEVYKQVCEFLGIKNIQLLNKEPKNQSPISQKISEETKEKLNSYFQPYNEELYKLINQKFDW